MNSADLSRLSTLLDEVLDLPLPEREDWVNTLKGDAVALAPTLRKMLARATSGESKDLLDRGPSFEAPPGLDDRSPCFQPGDTVGPYRLQRELGRGGMGEVWLAERHDGQMKRSVALKLPLLTLRRDVLVQRFERERDIVGALNHPHIAKLYDAGLAADGQPYLAFEHVAGEPITQYCDAHALGKRARVEMMLQVLDAVQHAHANLVIHRDLKPSNVIVTTTGQAMLLDFGISKLLQPDQAEVSDTELTQIGGHALTIGYAAPEQLKGDPISIATDIWALGVLLYELLTGQRPFGGTRREMEEAILTLEPTRHKGLPTDLAKIVLKALRKEPIERYTTVDALAEDLQRWLRGEAVHARSHSAWYRASRFVARNKVAAGTAAVVLAVVLGAAGVALQQARVAQQQAQLARVEAATAEAVQRFLEGIFRTTRANQSDPVAARQRTAKQLLDEGTARLETDLEAVPRAKLRVLNTLAEMYADMAQLGPAARLQGQRAQLALELEGPTSRTRVLALTGQVHALAAVDRLQEAASVLAQATSAAPVGSDPELRIRVLIAQAHLAERAGPADGVAAATEAVTLLRARDDPVQLHRALSMRGSLLLYSGHPADAVAPLREAILLAQQPGAAAGAAAMPLRLLGQAYRRLGRLDEAVQALRTSIAEASRSDGEYSLEVLFARSGLTQVLNSADRWHDALQEAMLAHAITVSLRDAADRELFGANVAALVAEPLIRLGRLAQADVLLADANAAAQRHPEGVTYRFQLQIESAELNFESRSDAEAAVALDRLRDMAVNASGDARGVVREEALLRAWFELRRGHPATVAAAVETALHAPVRVVDTDASAALAESARCFGHVAARDAGAARRSCEAAIEGLIGSPSVFKRTQLQVRLRWALGRLLLDTGDIATARPLLAEAVRLFDVAGDPERSTALIDPLLALADAAQADGDLSTAAASRARAARIAAAQPRLAPHYKQALERALTRQPAQATRRPPKKA